MKTIILILLILLSGCATYVDRDFDERTGILQEHIMQGHGLKWFSPDRLKSSYWQCNTQPPLFIKGKKQGYDLPRVENCKPLEK